MLDNSHAMASSLDALAALGTNFTTLTRPVMRVRIALLLVSITVELAEEHLTGTMRQMRCRMCAILSSASAAEYGQLLSLHATSHNKTR